MAASAASPLAATQQEQDPEPLLPLWSLPLPDDDPGPSRGSAPTAPEPASLGWTRNAPALVAATAAVHGGFMVWTWAVWYRNQTQSETFLVLNEGYFGGDTYAGGADKFGHMFGNYALTRGTAQLFAAAGMRPLPRLLLANGFTLASYLAIEIKDGYHARFGFSWQDIVANVTGNLLATAFELWPALDETLDLRLHYVSSAAYLQRVAGSEANLGEDYSGMRFELLLKGAAFVPELHGNRRVLQPLGYLALGLGFATRGYKPVREAIATQTISAVIALDVQTLIDDVVYNRMPGRGRQLRVGLRTT